MSFLHICGRLVAVSALLALVAQPAQAKKPEKDADIPGPLTEVLDSADVASLAGQQAAALVGKVMVVLRHSVTFNREPCRALELRRRREDAAKHVHEGYHAGLAILDSLTPLP